MITDNGKLDFTDAYGVIYHVEWSKIDNNYQVITRIDTPFRYGKKSVHTATGTSPAITLYSLGTRIETLQYLKLGDDKPLAERVLKNEDKFVPVSPNALVYNKPFKYELGYGTMVSDPCDYYCLEGSHFTEVDAHDNEIQSLWGVVNIDGSVVPNNQNLEYVDVWHN